MSLAPSARGRVLGVEFWFSLWMKLPAGVFQGPRTRGLRWGYKSVGTLQEGRRMGCFRPGVAWSVTTAIPNVAEASRVPGAEPRPSRLGPGAPRITGDLPGPAGRNEWGREYSP